MAKNTKHCKRRLTVFGTISLIVIVLFVYNLISYISTVKRLENQEKELKNRLVELQNDNTNLKEEIEKLKNPEYLAKYARENFLYSKDGEYIIRIDQINKEINKIDDSKVEYKTRIVVILLCLTLSILFIYIFIKVKKRSLE